MASKATNNNGSYAANADRSKGADRRPTKKGSRVTQARAQAQRAKLDAREQIHQHQDEQEAVARQTPNKKTVRQEMQAKRRVIEALIEAYIQDHIGGNPARKRSSGTAPLSDCCVCSWQRSWASPRSMRSRPTISAPGLRTCAALLLPVAECAANAPFRPMPARRVPSSTGWSAVAPSSSNPFERVVFPKVGRPLIQTITTEEFEQLLLACAPPHETGPFAERAAVRNRAILWLLYDTGIRVSELTHLHVSDLDRKKGVVTVLGKGAKERRVALGQNCLRNLSYYLDKHRPDGEELAEWGSAGEDHLFLSETRQPLTKNGMEMLFKRLKKRAGITGKRISPHILRHTFAMNYLIKSNDPFSLQELLGHEDLTTVLNYIHMNDTILQEQKRKYSPGDHLPTRMPGPRETRRKSHGEKGER